MKLNYRLRSAINQYYAFKSINNGMFRDTEEKEYCCQMICDEARKSGIIADIIPGWIILSRSGKTLVIKGPVLL